MESRRGVLVLEQHLMKGTHALQLRRREPPVVVGCARGRRRPALPRAGAAQLVPSPHSKEEGRLSLDRRPSAIFIASKRRASPQSSAASAPTAAWCREATRECFCVCSRAAWVHHLSGTRSGPGRPRRRCLRRARSLPARTRTRTSRLCGRGRAAPRARLRCRRRGCGRRPRASTLRPA